MDVKYVREHPYVQWEWLEMINSCRETAEDLNHQLTRGAKSARMITQGIAEVCSILNIKQKQAQ